VRSFLLVIGAKLGKFAAVIGRGGLLARPTVAEIYRYRAAVDDSMQTLMTNLPEGDWEQLRRLLVLGLNHEQQHHDHHQQV